MMKRTLNKIGKNCECRFDKNEEQKVRQVTGFLTIISVFHTLRRPHMTNFVSISDG